MHGSRGSITAAHEEWTWYQEQGVDDEDNDERDTRRKDDDPEDFRRRHEDEERIHFCWGGWLQHLLQWRKEPTTLHVTFASTSSFEEEDHASSSGSSSSARSTHSPLRSSCKRVPSMEDIIDEEKMQFLLLEAHRWEAQGRWREALKSYQRVLEAVRATGRSAPQMGQIHYRTGLIHFKCQSYTESLYHLDQALFLYQVQGETCARDLVPVYGALGQVHVARHDWERAMGYFQMALDSLDQPLLEKEGAAPWVAEQQSHIQEAMRATQIAMGTV